MSHDRATGSVVVVTDALSGIGEATALAFAQRGDVVVIAGRDDDTGERLARYLTAVGAADALFVRADVRFEREIADVMDTTTSCFGRLDITVNNAGTEGRLAPIVELGATQYADTFGSNVLGTLLSMKHELRVMQRQGRGVVINVASHFGDRGGPKSALYTASECAIIGLTRAASAEAARFGIRVHAVAPEFDADAITARVGGNPDSHSAAANIISHDRATTTGKVVDAIVHLAGTPAI
jgi:NAD(P)-dependent dehydrogenase (short-subunit alcohol dehydrogenase family)